MAKSTQLNKLTTQELNYSLPNTTERHTLWEKARKLALTIIPALALTLSACWDKTPYEKASDEYISAQEHLDKATQKKEKALQEYNDAVKAYEDAVRDCESAKQRVKQEAQKL